MKNILCTTIFLFLGTGCLLRGQIVIGSSSQLSIKSGTYLVVGGNYSSSGTLNSASGSNVKFTWIAAQTISKSGGETFANLVINKSSNNVTLNNDISVTETLALSGGSISLGSNNLTIGPSGTIAGSPSASSMIIATGAGSLNKSFASLGAFTFPVGDVTNYSPVTLNSLTAASYSAATIGVNVSNTKYSLNNSTVDYLNRYWTLTASGITNPTYSITLEYAAGDVTGTEANLYGGKYDGTSWILLGPVNPAAHTFSFSGLTSFSTFTAGEAGALPVELTSFTSRVANGNPVLNWQTATEINNSGFAVLRSTAKDSKWEKIAFVNGAGTSNSPKSYSYVDKTALAGKYSYKLKQVDNNGSYKFSTETLVDLGSPDKFIVQQNYPNPFNPNTVISYYVPADAKVSLRVFDALGTEVTTLVDEFQTAGSHTVNFTSSGVHLSSGVYFYKLQSGSFAVVKRMMVLK